MAAVTHLALVNRVLVHMREAQVTELTSDAYAAAVSRFVNDARMSVEDIRHWEVLRSLVAESITSGNTAITVTGTNPRSHILGVYNTTSQNKLTHKTREWVLRQNQLGTVTNAEPSVWAYDGFTSTGAMKIVLFAPSDATYTISIDCIIPQEELGATDNITVPSQPVYLRALATAIAERGEDGGISTQDIMFQYNEALTDAITRENQLRYGTNEFQGDWHVI